MIAYSKVYCVKKLAVADVVTIKGEICHIDVLFLPGKFYESRKLNFDNSDGYLIRSSDFDFNGIDYIQNEKDSMLKGVDKAQYDEHFMSKEEYRKLKIKTFLENA